MNFLALEIIVTDAVEAAIAQGAGATRLELVAHRECGGLTPHPSTIERVMKVVKIPVHVIVRPHDDGFTYGAAERASIIRDAARAASLGASAIVVGGLTPEGDVDVELLGSVREAARRPMTFHRAFDVARDPMRAFDALARAPGVTRILTSGGARSAWEGRNLLRDLAHRSGPSILAGAGITAGNVAKIVRETGVREVHVGAGARSGDRLDALAIRRIVSALSGIAGARAEST